MAKRRYSTNRKTIQARIKEGRGSGHGANYKPWLLIHDVPSKGRSHRTKGLKAQRTHHLLSDLEYNYFCILDLSPYVFDIREQYPLLPLEETLSIAREYNIEHPQDPFTQEPVVITTDFLVNCNNGQGEQEQARTAKYCSDLESSRTIEKLEIERLYWQNRDIDWGIVTEQDINTIAAKTAVLLHQYCREDINGLSNKLLVEIQEALEQRLLIEKLPLGKAATNVDAYLELPKGSSLSAAYFFMATSCWIIDFNLGIDARKRLNFQHLRSISSE